MSSPRRRGSSSPSNAAVYWVPASALRSVHVSEFPSSRHGLQRVQPMFEGDWAWGSCFRAAVPSAEAGDDPGGPWEALVRMRVGPGGTAIGSVDGFEGSDFCGREYESRGEGAVAITCLGELQDDDGGAGSDGDELEQTVGGVELAVFDLQALLLEGAEELLDHPAHSVPVDDLPSGSGIGRRVGGKQPPSHRLGPGRRIWFAQLDQGQRHPV